MPSPQGLPMSGPDVRRTVPTLLTDELPLPTRAVSYPELRYMGGKKRLLPWIHQVLSSLNFDSALDPFSGSGCVAYLMKAMNKRVVASDFLNFSTVFARAAIENHSQQLDESAVLNLLGKRQSNTQDFIERTFGGIFYTR